MAGAAGQRLPEPARRNSGLARLVFEVRDGLLVAHDRQLEAFELGERLLPVLTDDRFLGRIVARDEVGGETVDLALERDGERLIVIELRLKCLMRPDQYFWSLTGPASFGLSLSFVVSAGVAVTSGGGLGRRLRRRDGDQVLVRPDLRRVLDRPAALLLFLRQFGQRLRAQGCRRPSHEDDRQRRRGPPEGEAHRLHGRYRLQLDRT